MYIAQPLTYPVLFVCHVCVVYTFLLCIFFSYGLWFEFLYHSVVMLSFFFFNFICPWMFAMVVCVLHKLCACNWKLSVTPISCIFFLLLKMFVVFCVGLHVVSPLYFFCLLYALYIAPWMIYPLSLFLYNISILIFVLTWFCVVNTLFPVILFLLSICGTSVWFVLSFVVFLFSMSRFNFPNFLCVSNTLCYVIF